MDHECAQQNLLLASLSMDVQERLFSAMEWVKLPQGKVIYESGDAVRHVYFPTDAIIAMLCVTESGESVEISVVGNDGMAGLAVFMGGGSMSSSAVVQSSGHAYRLQSYRFMDEYNRHGELLQLILRYTQTVITCCGSMILDTPIGR